MLQSIANKFQSKVDEVGWTKITAALFSSATHRIMHFPNNFYVKNVLQNEIIAQTYRFKKPTIFLFGYARSGTSWVGKVLSLSPEIAYLREPVTQTFVQKFNYEQPFFSAKNKKVNENFEKIIHQSFAGIPPISDVIKNRSDFFPFTRRKRSLLIKEVTSGTIDYVVENFSPKMIILLRHPAAVTDSFCRMGWLENVSYEEFGYRYGKVMADAINAVKAATYRIQLYENLAQNPREEFSELLKFMNIDRPADFEEIIEEHCENNNEKSHPYHTRRSSKSQVYKWKKNLSEEVVDAIKKGYMVSDLDYYREDSDWQV